MRKRIAQLFHNIIRKETKFHEEALEEPKDLQEFQMVQRARAQGARSVQGLQTQGPPAVEEVGRDIETAPMDRKTFIKFVDKILIEDSAQGCLIIADLDRFKEVNDIYGHDTGDLVLQRVAATLRDVFGDSACMGRLGGDIFALWVQELYPDDAAYVRRQVGKVNDRLLHSDGKLPPVSLSAGAAFSEKGDDGRSLGKKANKTLYRVKESGRCGCEIYEGS